jgi:hypothetical protein
MKRWWVSSSCETYGFAVWAHGERDAIDQARAATAHLGRKIRYKATELRDGGTA